MTQKYRAIRDWFPMEVLEPNWRLYSFIVILLWGGYALFNFPVLEPVNGYLDPFYSPTILILPLPALFRLTCYAYRKDYHRHLFNHPLGCAMIQRMAETDTRAYTGERNILFRVNNFHRYFLYAGIAILPFFYYDFYYSMTYTDVFSLRIGSLLLLANALLLSGWTFGCHAFRHLVGGRVDCYTCTVGGGGAKAAFDGQTKLNKRHEAFAWASLLVITGVDLYIRGLSMGLPIDFRII